MTHWGDEDRDFFDTTEPDDGAFYLSVFLLAVLTLIVVGLAVT